MTILNKAEDIETISESLSTWLIKYCSSKYLSPIYFIWYYDTDENSTSKLLSFKSREVFAIADLKLLYEKLMTYKEEIVWNTNHYLWLEKIKRIEIIENTTYDLTQINLSEKQIYLTDDTIEKVTNFINLYDDLLFQDKSNEYLAEFYENKHIQKIWNYYYNFIFWPRFNDKEKFQKWDKPKLRIDKKKLKTAFINLVNSFEERIRLT